MQKMLNLMVACAENRVMGRKNRLPWHIPEDLKFFHDETAGKTIVLGRICYQTWPRAREDGRRLVVVTSDATLEQEGVRTAGSVPEALAIAETMTGEIYVNGGERIFEEVLAMERPMRLHLTLVHADVEGDRYFPEWRHLEWRELSRRDSADENFRYTFYNLERVLPGQPVSPRSAAGFHA
jgi:dihydrofolate reductase